MGTLEGKPASEVKQKLGERLFRVVKAIGREPAGPGGEVDQATWERRRGRDLFSGSGLGDCTAKVVGTEEEEEKGGGDECLGESFLFARQRECLCGVLIQQ
jgi:hypothetical protein